MAPVDEVVASIIDTEDEAQARRLEAELVSQTENGWHEGIRSISLKTPRSPGTPTMLLGQLGLLGRRPPPGVQRGVGPRAPTIWSPRRSDGLASSRAPTTTHRPSAAGTA